MKKILYPTLLSLALLQACGGGGSDGASAPVTPPPSNGGNNAPVVPPAASDEGSVSASFVRTDASRYMLMGVSSQSMGRLSGSVQAASGAMTTLGTNVLSDASVTKNIAGDASFALGRWVAGTVTRSSGRETLTGTDNRAYHYLAYNPLAAMPATGSANCDSGAFTTPTYTGGGAANSALSGTASGSATLGFDANGMAVSGGIHVTVGEQSATVALPLQIDSASIGGIVSNGGGLYGSGAGAGVQLTDAGNGNYALAVPYAAVMPSGARYIGVARLSCTNT